MVAGRRSNWNYKLCILLLFMCQGGFLTVRVTNSCEQDVDLAHIWVEGYSTKGENRGLDWQIISVYWSSIQRLYR